MSEEHYVSGEEHRAQTSKQLSAPKKVTISMTTALLAVAAIALCGTSFAIGVSYQKRHTKVPTGANFVTGGRFGEMGQRRIGDLGQVTAISSTSITVNSQRSGTDKTYTIDASTTVLNAGSAGAVSDIKTGDTVIVETSSSSSAVASRVVVNPSFGGDPAGSGPTTTMTQ